MLISDYIKIVSVIQFSCYMQPKAFLSKTTATWNSRNTWLLLESSSRLLISSCPRGNGGQDSHFQSPSPNCSFKLLVVFMSPRWSEVGKGRQNQDFHMGSKGTGVKTIEVLESPASIKYLGTHTTPHDT